jgi:curved DNA-binding protein CbpA
MKESWEIHWKNYYKILQIDPLAEPEVVKAAHDKLALKYHPDRNKEAIAAKLMTDINEAYEILSHPEKRKRYYTAYLQKQAGSYRVETPSYSSQPQTEATPDTSHVVTQLRYCSKCRDNTNMRIGFVNKEPTFGTCPRCQTTWDLRPKTHYTFPTDELIPDLKRRLEELRNISKQGRGRTLFKLNKSKPNKIPVDMTPLTLGIESPKGRMKPVIPRDTPIPTSGNVTITTVKDYQSNMIVRLLQGERVTAADNHTLGRLVIDDIAPAPRGVSQIEVTLNIDADGMLNVSARDKVSGRLQRIILTACSALSKDETQKMRREAQEGGA